MVVFAAVTILMTRAAERDAARVASQAYDADAWFRLQRGYPTNRTPAVDALDRARRQAQPRPGAPRPNLQIPGESWVSIGPRPINVQGTLPYAGRVTAIAPHPASAATIYIGTDSGGIWRTTDAGLTWQSLTDDIPVPAIQSLAVDPIDPRLIYATTINRTYPTRIMRSTDAGATWTVSSIISDALPLSPVQCSVNVFKACIPPSSGRLLIDPVRAGSPNTSTIFYAAASHLLRSDDSGRTFRSVLSLPFDLDFAGPDVYGGTPEVPYLRDAALDPTRPERLFVAVAQPRCIDASCTRMDSVISLYRSTDAGGRWTNQGLVTLQPYSIDNTRYADPGAVYVPRVRLAIAPSDPDTIALAFRDEQLGRPRVLRSVTGGNIWTETTPVTNSLTWPLGIAFSPTDANTMFVGSNSVYRTTNGGQSWTTLASTHPDNIVIAFTADRTMLLANDGGIYISTNAGTSFTALHMALPITEFYSVAAHPSNGLILAGGTQDNGTAMFQGALGWAMVVGGDGGDTVFDPDPQSNILYAEVEWYFSGGGNVFDFFRCQSSGCLTKSLGIDKSLAGPFIPRMAPDRSSPQTLWLTAERLFRTDSRGDNWIAGSPSVFNEQRCWQDAALRRTCANARYFTAAAVAPSNSQIVYAGTLNGDVWLTTNRGSGWRSVAGDTAGPLPVRAVNDIAVDPLDPASALVAYSGFDVGGSGIGHLFRTTDNGATWLDITGNLPDMPVNTILIDPDSVAAGTSRVVYVGTDIGVFRATLDTPVPNWQPFGAGLPPVVVNRLAYNAATRQLLAATYGRGIWAISPRFAR